MPCDVGDGPGRPAPWRIATFNIRHGLGRDGRVDLARTARTIAALRADAIGLQEVDVAYGPRSGHEDQASRLAELLGVEPSRIGVKATTTERLGFTGREEGIAATASATVRLPWDEQGWDDKGRSA